MVTPEAIKDAEVISEGVVLIDMSSIGITFDEFMQAGCRDQDALL